MSSNSIKNELTKEGIISEIKLLLSADINKKQSVVIVEGDDDIKLLRKFLQNDVHINESFSGKGGVEEIVSFFYDKRVIGIRDKDYDEISNNKIFIYDYSCLEMMIISYKNIFESMYYEYYNGTLSYEEFFCVVLNGIKRMSLLRKINSEEKYEIKLKGISISNIIDENYICLERLMEEVVKRNKDKFQVDFIETLKDRILNEEEKDYNIDELLHITQGHDFIDNFKINCRKNSGREPSKDDVASSLRCLFNDSHFKTTKLYNSLNEYESLVNLNITKK
ncbi:hypothetical protein ABFP60_00230 [Clostridioides difficile]